MSKTSMQAVLGNLQTFGRRRMKMAPFMMAVSGALMLTLIIFLVFFLQGRAPDFNPLPSFRPGVPEYSYSIFGPGEKMLFKPMGIAVSGNRIYVTDTMNHRVQVFAPNGDHIFDFGSYGTAPGELNFPYGIAVSNREIFVADSYNGDISVFDDQGNFLRFFGQRAVELNNPAGLLFHQGKLFVTNMDPGYIMIFDPATEELLEIFGGAGDAEGGLSFPNALAAGPDGNLYVSDTANHRIQIYSPQGDFVRTLVDSSGIVDSPRGLAFDNHGRLMVVNKMYSDVVILDNNGEAIGNFGNGIFNFPNGLAVDGKGGVYVTDHISVLFFQ